MNNIPEEFDSYEQDVSYQENQREKEVTHSCCIAMLSLMCGYLLLVANHSLQNQPSPISHHLHHRQCKATIPISYLFALAFFAVFALRFIFLCVSCLGQQKNRLNLFIVHYKLKRVEILSGLMFFFAGSFLLMLKEDCYELNLSLLFCLIITAFMILQICCYDLEPDDLIFNDEYQDI